MILKENLNVWLKLKEGGWSSFLNKKIMQKE